MQIQPAHIDQIQRGRFGKMVAIDADVGGVAADLAAIDPGLKVRFVENGPHFAVYHEEQTVDGVSTYLVLTVQAHQTATGIWGGLDQRVVERVRQIDGWGRGGYDYPAEVEKMNARARKDARAEFQEKMGILGEQAAHALRKDRGTRYKSRTFVPRDLSA